MAKEMNYEALNANLKMLEKKGELAFEQAKAAGTLTPEQEKFSALISDEAFLEKLFAADSAAEAAALFRENGLSLSEEDVNALGKYIIGISKLLIENGGEISEEELERVAGGSFNDFVENRDMNEQVGAGIGAVAGITAAGLGMGFYGGKLGIAVGTAICPGLGTGIGAGIGLVLGTTAGIAIGYFGGATGGIGVVKGVKNIGSWIKSWF